MPAVIDRRINKTRLALRDALLALLAERGWDEVNVQEICDRGNIGRSTFYLHYRSKEDLLSEGLNDLRDALLAYAKTQHEALAFLPGLVQHMIEHRLVFKSIIGRRSGRAVELRFRDMVLQLVEQDMALRSGPHPGAVPAARFIAGGLVELMEWWVDTPQAPPAAKLLEHMFALAGALLDFRVA